MIIENATADQKIFHTQKFSKDAKFQKTVSRAKLKGRIIRRVVGVPLLYDDRIIVQELSDAFSYRETYELLC